MDELEEKGTTGRNPLLWPVRFLLHWGIKLIVLFFVGIRAILRPRAVRFGLVGVVLLGVVAWGLTGGLASGRPTAASGSQATYLASSSGNSIAVQNTEKLPEPPAVESYLKAQANFDANGMWATISDDLKKQLASSNTTLKDLQAQLDSAKQAGRHYGHAIYVGGATLDSGSNAYFYVLSIDTPSGTQRVPYIYVVDSTGKIASIQ